LSYAGGSGRSFGPKGSSQKKDHKRKQEFHKHKIKFTEEDHLDFEQLKVRATTALDKLGHQVFSVEPGGYTFHNWMTSFNLLLDDFEEKAGQKNLPKEYYDTRLKLTADLLKPAETADIDWEIRNMETEIDSVMLHMSKLSAQVNERRGEWRERSAKIDRLRGERVALDKRLKDATEALGREKKKQSFFSRLVDSREKATVSLAKERVVSTEAEIDKIDESIHELETRPTDSVEELDNNLATLREKLGELQENLAAWNLKKQELSQLSEKRVEATAALSKIISSLKLGDVLMEEKPDEPE
jgi:chromosome segregation ATPase